MMTPSIPVLIIPLSILLFLGPIIVLIVIVGNIHLGPIQIDLSTRKPYVRWLIAFFSLGSWLALYIPIVSLASKAMFLEISNAPPVRIEVAADNTTTSSSFWNHSDLSFSSRGIVDRQMDELGECAGGGHITQYWLLPDQQTGWVQIDLLRNYHIVKLRWLNTHNGRCGDDRATTNFHIALSQTGDFNGEDRIVYSGEMNFSQSPRFEEVILSPGVSARFVRFYVDDFYGKGGGLNELEVYTDVP